MAEFQVGDSVIYIKTGKKDIVKVVHLEIDG